MGSIADRNRSVQVFVNCHFASGQRVPPAGLVELPDLALQTEGLVLGDSPLGLNREDPVQIRSAAAPKGGPLHRRRHGEFAVELRRVVVPSKNWLACSGVPMPANCNSCGNRPCQVPKLRSLRPRACGEYAGFICTPSSITGRQTFISDRAGIS
jgi:hypothetical protein